MHATLPPPAAAGARALPARPAPFRGDLRLPRRLSLAAAALLAVTAVAGLVYGPRGLYQDDPLLLPQLVGQDAVALLLALPLLLASIRGARRGSAAGAALWAGTLFWIAYWYYFYVAGVRFGPLFLVHAALVSASAYALVALLLAVDPEGYRACLRGAPRMRLAAGVLVGVALLFTALWTGDLARRLRSGLPLDGVSRSVFAIDLVVVLPASFVVGVALWRGRAWGLALAGPMLVKTVGSMLTLLVTATAVRLAGQPVDPAQVAAYALTLAVSLACTVPLLRALRR